MKRRPFDQGCDRLSRPPPGQAISLIGGKGGIGKSTLALNLAISLAQRDRRVALLDAADQFAHTDVLLATDCDGADIISVGGAGLQPARRAGSPPHPWLPGVAPGLDAHPGDAIERTRSRLNISHLGPSTAGASSDNMADQLARLRDSSDALLIDCGSNLSERSISLALQSDLAVLVATPEPTALTDAYATAKILLRRGYRNNVGLVVNMTRSRREANETVRRLLRAASHFLGLSLQRLGEIPFDRHATQAARLRRPVLLASPRCAAAQAVEQVARRLPLAEPLTPVTDNALWVRVASLFL